MAPPPIIEAGSGQSDTATASIFDAHLSTEATEIPIGRAGFNLGRVKIYFSLPSDQQVDPGPRRFMEALAAGSESSSEWVATASKTIAESLSALARRRDVYDQKFGPFLPNIWNADKLASQVSTLDQAIKSQAGLKTYAVTDATTPVKYQNSSEASATGKKTSQIMIVVPLAKID